jgi:hypothetical protein
MDDYSRIWELFRNLMQQLPSMVTMVGCIVFAISRWRRHPTVSLFAVISLTFLLLHSIIFTAIYVWFPDWLVQTQGFSIEAVLTVLGLVYNTTLAVGFVLMLVTIFMQRHPQTKNA